MSVRPGRNLHRLFMAAIAATYASSAFAIFDAEVLAGRRWYQWDIGGSSTHFAAEQMTAAVHANPIPVVPISFGISGSLFTLNKDDLRDDTDPTYKVGTGSGSEVGVDFMAWVPLLPIVTPYVRFNYPIMSKILLKASYSDDAGEEKTLQRYKITGYHLNAGLKFSPAPMVSILVEVGKGAQKSQLEELTFNGTKIDTIDDSTKSDLKSNAVLFGIELGI